MSLTSDLKWSAFMTAFLGIFPRDTRLVAVLSWLPGNVTATSASVWLLLTVTEHGRRQAKVSANTEQLWNQPWRRASETGHMAFERIGDTCRCSGSVTRLCQRFSQHRAHCVYFSEGNSRVCSSCSAALVTWPICNHGDHQGSEDALRLSLCGYRGRERTFTCFWLCQI